LRVLSLTLIALIILVTVRCGTRTSVTAVRGGAGISPDNLTGGERSGRPYTGFGPAPELDDIKREVPATDANRSFAAQIESAFLMHHHRKGENPNTLKVFMKWAGLEKPLEFWGEIKVDNGKLVATLKDETEQKRGFVIEAICHDDDCNVVSAYLMNNKVPMAGLMFRKKIRDFQMRISKKDFALTRCYDKATQDEIDRYIKGVKVTASSTEVIPGRSHFKIYEGLEAGTPASTIEGDLLRTDGDCTPIKGLANKSIFTRICLAGNNETGKLVFKTELPPVPKDCAAPNPHPDTDPDGFFVIVDPDEPKNPDNGGGTGNGGGNNGGGTGNGGGNSGGGTGNGGGTGGGGGTVKPGPVCEMPIPEEKAHPIVVSMYKDCGHPTVKKKIDTVWSKGGRRADLVSYLGLHQSVLQGDTKGRAGEYATMKEVLKDNGLPVVLGFVALHETGFHGHKIGTSGELGHWQLMKATAKDFGIKTDEERRRIDTSTLAISKFFKMLIKEWTDEQTGEVNIKMVFASYNAGLGAMRKRVKDAKAVLNGSDQAEALSIDEIRLYSEDFWELVEMNMFKKNKVTPEYVPSVLAAIFAGARPEEVGLGTAEDAFTELD
jgi:uncharacterized membrane protein YgcG